MVHVFTINEYGLVDYSRYRLENEGYTPQPNEITEVWPQDGSIIIPRWNGKQWVEGKDHPKAPMPEPNPDFPEVQLPTEGIFRLLSNDIKPTQAEKCILESDLTASYVAQHLYCLSDPRIVQALIDAVQKLNKRLSALEKQTSRKR